MGRLFLYDEAITSDQVSNIRAQISNPTYTYDANPDSLWYLYHMIMFTLQKSHPRSWMEQQVKVHEVIENLYLSNAITQPCIEVKATVTLEEVADPNQITLEFKEAVVIENTVEEVVEQVETTQSADNEWISLDSTWVCLKCNTEQGASSVWYDGQLCSNCANESE